METFKVRFLPTNTEVTVNAGTTVMEAATESEVEIEGPCGGKGTCGKCRVRLVNEGEGRWDQACRIPVTENLTVEIPQTEVSLNRKSELTKGVLDTEIDPGVRKIYCRLEPPSIQDQVPDATRLLEVLENDDLKFKLNVLHAIPQTLRADDFKVTVVLGYEQVLAIEPGDTESILYGLAVDIGTTTVVASLVNMVTGETVATASATNTQNIFGADVISRIEHVMQEPRGLQQLNQRVVGVINQLIVKLTQTAEIESGTIYQAAIVGNTTMSHLFLGLNPSYLATSPFIPVTAHLIEAEAKELGLAILPEAPVFVLPNIAGYVGADTVGVILATGIDQTTGVRLAVDIGTNGEIVLAHDGHLLTCSTAAGPAFEGAEIQFGMRAAAGAIESVKLTDDVHLKVIEDAPVKGICGSGLMDAVAEFVRVGIIDSTGRMLTQEDAGHLPPFLSQRLGTNSKGNYFILASAEETGSEVVILTQKDVRELQLAKAAVRAGIQILLSEADLTYEEIDEVLLAGAFGNYIEKTSALTLGLLPPVPQGKIKSVGNAAGAGAKLALLSSEIRQRAKTVAKQVRHIELSTRKDFQDQFVNGLGFEEIAPTHL